MNNGPKGVRAAIPAAGAKGMVTVHVGLSGFAEAEKKTWEEAGRELET